MSVLDFILGHPSCFSPIHFILMINTTILMLGMLQVSYNMEERIPRHRLARGLGLHQNEGHCLHGQLHADQQQRHS
jgi:hypothetical protein